MDTAEFIHSMVLQTWISLPGEMLSGCFPPDTCHGSSSETFLSHTYIKLKKSSVRVTYSEVSLIFEGST
ncbi:hypothetical protein VNO80_26679 [Phaseolus coccineus]|uniref:Uncharacterized protein n=1 Tax=Phaseolus coccineus TaxID=3886 RepID=A0AAN9LKA7_PHACN